MSSGIACLLTKICNGPDNGQDGWMDYVELVGVRYGL